MAIYHLNQGHISRSTGRSSVQSAAYITGADLHESRRNLDVNYKNRHSDIAFSNTLTPEHAKEDYKTLSVWDKLESFEDAYAAKRFKSEETLDKHLNTAQTAMTIVVALPRELDVSVAKDLVEDFAKERFLSRNLIVTYAIHDDEGNPHAHLQIARRAINELGEFSEFKDREICTPTELRFTRKLWADLTNSYLEREGFDTRITEKSFADLGINLEPSQHRGWVSDKLETMGVKSRIVVENEEVFERNREALKENPEIILNELTSRSATFTQTDLLKVIRSRIGDDAKVVSQIFEKALSSSHAVGIGLEGVNRYTSQAYLESESKALSLLERHMTLNKVQMPSDPLELESARKDGIRHGILSHADFASLSNEQSEAFVSLTQEKPLSVLMGRAGAGKTTSLKAVCRYYERLGYSIMGTSLSALAAKNLGDETNIQSSTLHSLLYKWERYEQAQEKFLSYDSLMEEGAFKQLQWFKDLTTFKKDVLTEKSLILVDEAGMIGTRQWKDLLYFAEKHKAKIIAVGDDHQFKAIEAGDFFREVKDKAQDHGCLSELKTIRRQKEEWMKDASHLFAELKTQEALSLYEQKGHIHATSQLEDDIASAYLEKTKLGQAGLVLSFTNAQCQSLNKVIRTKLREEGLIEQHDSLRLNSKDFAIGDKLVFLKNDKTDVHLINNDGERITTDFIRNGTTGIFESVSHAGLVTVRINDNHLAVFHKDQYTHLDYGYALTTHKSQGQTVDFTLIAASQRMDAKGLYVAMTRHRDDVQLYYKKEDFSSFKDLAYKLSHFEHKDLVKDYTIRPDHEEAWQRVQDYKLCVLDAAYALKEKDYESYGSLKKDQIALGKEILGNYDAHKLYLHQLSLTQEMLEISTGKKQRPLSMVEEKAKLTVELYREVSHLARTLRDNPKEKESYQDARFQRDTLAKTILENYPLHKEFVLSYKGQIHKKMMENQVVYREKGLQQNVANGNADSPNLDGKQQGFKPQSSFTPYERTASDITQDLNANIKDLAHHFLGKPTSSTSKQWRYGSKGSITIYVSGVKQGLYSDFERGESGNAVTFIAHQMGLDKKEAFKWGTNWLGHGGQQHAGALRIAKDQSSHPKIQEQNWIPTYPIKEAFPDLKKDSNLSYMMKGRREVARFAYKDADSNILGYVVRLEDRHGNKITPTLTYCRSGKGEHEWRFKGFTDERPLYGLDQLKQKPDSPVLVVEGEKTCEAARELFPNHAVVTWSGGCGAVQKSDWSVLKDKEVTLWPDHDKAGHVAAEKIQGILDEQYQTPSKIVSLDSTFPHKWDLADKLPEGITVEQLREKVAMDKIHTLLTLHAQSSKLPEDKITDAKDLIHTLYQTYRTANSTLTDDQVMERALRIGVYTSEIFKGTPNYDLAYKVAIGGYFAFKDGVDDKPLQRAINLYKNGDLNEYLNHKMPAISDHLGQMSQTLKQSLMKDKITKDHITKIAGQMGTGLNKGFEEREILLINALYEKYQEMHPHLEKQEILEKAVSVGIFMSDYHILFGEKESFKGHALTHAYKIGLSAYHCFKAGHKDALEQACLNEDKIDHHLAKQMHQDHYKDQVMDQHISKMTDHLQAQHLHQLHQEQMHQMQVHQQRQMQAQLSRGFER